MGGIERAISGKPKAPPPPAPDPQIAKDLAAARAAETKRKTDLANKDKEDRLARERGKRGRRSLFAANNMGRGFEEMADKKRTLA